MHSKVLIMDDELVSVGSANFNNRSMGFDTECNIAIEARGEARICAAIAHLRDRLLAEHLGIA
ncbi:MAG TPA: phospholipase D-like domain-containing protein, partial [Casimicrobiaceae bacterium]